MLGFGLTTLFSAVFGALYVFVVDFVLNPQEYSPGAIVSTSITREQLLAAVCCGIMGVVIKVRRGALLAALAVSFTTVITWLALRGASHDQIFFAFVFASPVGAIGACAYVAVSVLAKRLPSCSRIEAGMSCQSASSDPEHRDDTESHEMPVFHKTERITFQQHTEDSAANAKTCALCQRSFPQSWERCPYCGYPGYGGSSEDLA